jgi:hypothetical protein
MARDPAAAPWSDLAIPRAERYETRPLMSFYVYVWYTRASWKPGCPVLGGDDLF